MNGLLVLLALLRLETATSGEIARWISAETGADCHRTTALRQLKRLEAEGSVVGDSEPFSAQLRPEVLWTFTAVGRDVARFRTRQLRKATN